LNLLIILYKVTLVKKHYFSCAIIF